MNKRKVLIMLSALILFLSVVAVTYGFVVKELNNNRQNVGVGTANVTLTYTDCASTNTADCANISAQLEPGDSITKTFEITNTGTGEATYTLYFTEILNTFKNDELVYKIEDLETGQLVVSETPVPYNETESNNAIAMENKTIGVGATKRFKMTITFLNKEYDQNENLNAEFKLKLGLNKARVLPKDTITALNVTPNEGTPNFDNISPGLTGYTTNIDEITGNTTERDMSSNQDNYYTYSDKYTFNSTTGKYSLVNPKIGKFSEVYEELKGKYAISALGSTSTNLESYNNVASLCKIGSNTTNTKVYFTWTSNSPEYNDNSERGLYSIEDDYGTSYYYRGAVTNNYIKFGKWSNTTPDEYVGYYSATSQNNYSIYSSLSECQNSTGYNKNCTKITRAGKDMFWRIIRINGDNSIRMIYDGTEAHANGEVSIDRVASAKIKFNEKYNDNAYVGYMYGLTGITTDANRCLVLENDTVTNKVGTYTTKAACEEAGGKWTTTAYEATHSNVKNSTIKEYLDNWYKANFLGTSYANYISDEIFCNDRSLRNSNDKGYGTNSTKYGAQGRLDISSNKSPILICSQKNDSFTVNDTAKGNGALSYPVGLITADEIALAGGKIYNSDGTSNNTSYYLYNNYSYWGMTPYNYSSYTYEFFNTNFLSAQPTNNNYSLVPVINLSASAAKLLVGTGTMTDPFVIQEQ